MDMQEEDAEEKGDSEVNFGSGLLDHPSKQERCGEDTVIPKFPGEIEGIEVHRHSALLTGLIDVEVAEKSVSNGVCQLNRLLDKNYVDASFHQLNKSTSAEVKYADDNSVGGDVHALQSLLNEAMGRSAADDSLPGKQVHLVHASIKKIQSALRDKQGMDAEQVEEKEREEVSTAPLDAPKNLETPLSFQVALQTLLKTFRVMNGCKGPLVGALIDKIPRLLSDLPKLALIENPRLAKQVRIETEKASLEAKQAGQKLDAFQMRKLLVKHTSSQMQDSLLGRKIQSAEGTASQVVSAIGEVLEKLLAEPTSDPQVKRSGKLRSGALVSLIALSIKKGSLLELLRTIKLLLIEGNRQELDTSSPREDTSKTYPFGRYLEELEDVLKELEEFHPKRFSDKPDPYSLQRSGVLYTFGKGDHGKLGHGSCEDNQDASHPYAHENCQDGRCSENAKEPKLVSTLHGTHLVKVTSLSTHAVALTKSGEIYTWGNGDKHRLGHGTTEKEYQPRLVSVLSGKPKVRDIACGLGHTLCLLETGQLFAWGNGSNGRLGVGDQEDRELAAPVTTYKGSTGSQEGRSMPEVVGIFCGASHSLAISKDGRCFSWGKNNQGQCGHGNILDNLVPCEIERLSPTSLLSRRMRTEEKGEEAERDDTQTDLSVKQMAGGWEHTLALTADGALYSFGSGYKDSRREILPPVLGHGSTERELFPRQIMTLMEERIVYCSCGWDHSMAINEAGELFTWGAGTNGKLGHGNEECQSIPHKVEHLHDYNIVQAEGGCEHTLALTAEGYVFSWGHGDSGRLGHGSSRTEKLPKRVDFFQAPAISIAVGDKYNLVLLQEENASSNADLKPHAAADEVKSLEIERDRLSKSLCPLKTQTSSFRACLKGIPMFSLASPATTSAAFWPAWMTDPNGLAVFMLIQLESLVNSGERSTSTARSSSKGGPFELTEPRKDFAMMVSLLEVAITAAFLSSDEADSSTESRCLCSRGGSPGQMQPSSSRNKCSPMRWVALWSVLRVISSSIHRLQLSQASSIPSGTFHSLHMLLIQTVRAVSRQQRNPSTAGPETGSTSRGCYAVDAQARQLASTQAISIVQAGFHYFYPDAASRLQLLQDILSAELPGGDMAKPTVVSVLALTLAQDDCISSILQHLLQEKAVLEQTLERLLELCWRTEYRQLLMAFHLHMLADWAATRGLFHIHLQRLFVAAKEQEELLRWTAPPLLCGLLDILRKDEPLDRPFFHQILPSLEELLFSLAQQDKLSAVQRLLARVISAITWRTMLLCDRPGESLSCEEMQRLGLEALERQLRRCSGMLTGMLEHLLYGIPEQCDGVRWEGDEKQLYVMVKRTIQDCLIPVFEQEGHLPTLVKSLRALELLLQQYRHLDDLADKVVAAMYSLLSDNQIDVFTPYEELCRRSEKDTKETFQSRPAASSASFAMHDIAWRVLQHLASLELTNGELLAHQADKCTAALEQSHALRKQLSTTFQSSLLLHEGDWSASTKAIDTVQAKGEPFSAAFQLPAAPSGFCLTFWTCLHALPAVGEVQFLCVRSEPQKEPVYFPPEASALKDALELCGLHSNLLHPALHIHRLSASSCVLGLSVTTVHKDTRSLRVATAMSSNDAPQLLVGKWTHVSISASNDSSLGTASFSLKLDGVKVAAAEVKQSSLYTGGQSAALKFGSKVKEVSASFAPCFTKCSLNAFSHVIPVDASVAQLLWHNKEVNDLEVSLDGLPQMHTRVEQAITRVCEMALVTHEHRHSFLRLALHTLCYSSSALAVLHALSLLFHVIQNNVRIEEEATAILSSIKETCYCGPSLCAAAALKHSQEIIDEEEANVNEQEELKEEKKEGSGALLLLDFIAQIYERLQVPAGRRCASCGEPSLHCEHDRSFEEHPLTRPPLRFKQECVHCVPPPERTRESERVLAAIEQLFARLLRLKEWESSTWHLLSSRHKPLLYRVLGASRIGVGVNATVRLGGCKSSATVVCQGTAGKLLKEAIGLRRNGGVEFTVALRHESLASLTLHSSKATHLLLACLAQQEGLPVPSKGSSIETMLEQLCRRAPSIKLDEELVVLQMDGEELIMPANIVSPEKTLSVPLDASKVQELFRSVFTAAGQLQPTDFLIRREEQVDRLWRECQALETVLVAIETLGSDVISPLLQDTEKLSSLLELACVDVNARAREVQGVVDKEAKLLLEPLLPELNGVLGPAMIAQAIEEARRNLALFPVDKANGTGVDEADVNVTENDRPAFQLVPMEYSESFSLHEAPVVVQQDVYSVTKAKTFGLQLTQSDQVQRFSFVRGCWGYEIELLEKSDKLSFGWADETFTHSSAPVSSSNSQEEGSTKWVFSLDATFNAGDILGTALDLDALQVRFYHNGTELPSATLPIATVHGAFPLFSLLPAHRIRLLSGSQNSPVRHLPTTSAQPLLEATAADLHTIAPKDEDPLRLQLQLQMMALQLQVGEASVQQHQQRLQEFQRRLERALLVAEGSDTALALPRPAPLHGASVDTQQHPVVISAKHRNMSRLLDHLRAQQLLNQLDELDHIQHTLPERLMSDAEIDEWISSHVLRPAGSTVEAQLDLSEFRRETCQALFEPHVRPAQVEQEEQRMAKTQGSWLTFALSQEGVAPVRRTRAPEALLPRLDSAGRTTDNNALSALLHSCQPKHVSLLLLLAHDVHRVNTARALLLRLIAAVQEYAAERKALCLMFSKANAESFGRLVVLSLRGGFLHTEGVLEGLWRMVEFAEDESLADELTAKALGMLEQASMRLYDGVYWGISVGGPGLSNWMRSGWSQKKWQMASEMLKNIEVSDTTALEQPNVELACVLLCMALEKEAHFAQRLQMLQRVVKSLNSPNLVLKEMLLRVGSTLLSGLIGMLAAGLEEEEKQRVRAILQRIPQHEMLQAHTERTWKEQSCRIAHSPYLKALTTFLVQMKRARALTAETASTNSSPEAQMADIEPLLEVRVLDVSASAVVIGWAPVEDVRKRFPAKSLKLVVEVGFGEPSHSDSQAAASLDEVVNPELYSGGIGDRETADWKTFAQVSDDQLAISRISCEDLLPDTQYRFRLVAIEAASEDGTSAVVGRGAGRRVDTMVSARLTLCSQLCGANLELSNANVTVRNRVNKKWNSVRTMHGFSKGVHKWFIHIDKCVSKNIFVGVMASQASVDNYVGADQWGWGYLANKAIWHDKAKVCSYGKLFREGDRVGVTLDMDSKKLSFSFNGQDLGIAVEGFADTVELFPAVSLYNLEDRVTFIHEASQASIPDNIRPFVGTALAHSRIGRLSEALTLMDVVNQVQNVQVDVYSQYRISARKRAWEGGVLSEVSAENLHILPHSTAPVDGLRPLFLLNDLASLEKWGIHRRSEAIDTGQGVGHVVGTAVGRLYYRVPWIQTPSLVSAAREASMGLRLDRSLRCFSFVVGNVGNGTEDEKASTVDNGNQDSNESSTDLTRIVVPWTAEDLQKRNTLPDVLCVEADYASDETSIQRSKSAPVALASILNGVNESDAGSCQRGSSSEWSLEQDRQLVQYLDQTHVDLKRPLRRISWKTFTKPGDKKFPLLGDFTADQIRARVSLFLYIQSLFAGVVQFADIPSLFGNTMMKGLLPLELKLQLIRASVMTQSGEVTVDVDQPILPQLKLDFPGETLKVKKNSQSALPNDQAGLMSLVLELAAQEFVEIGVLNLGCHGKYYSIKAGADKSMLRLFAGLTKLSIEHDLSFHRTLQLSSYCWKQLLKDPVVLADVEKEEDTVGRALKVLERAHHDGTLEQELQRVKEEAEQTGNVMLKGMVTRMAVTSGTEETPLEALLLSDRLEEFAVIREELGECISSILSYDNIANE